MALYIAGTATVTGFQTGPTTPEAERWMPKRETYLPAGDVAAEAIGQPVFFFFFGTQGVGWQFYPMMQQTQRLTNGYLYNTHDKQSAAAAAKLRSALLSISKRIEKRKAATTDSPKYLLLDPIQLPFYLYI
jgi:hypothetical protein